MDQRTLRPHEIKDAPTLRPAYAAPTVSAVCAAFIGLELEGWKIIRPLIQRKNSMIFYAENNAGEAAAVKLHSKPSDVPPLLRRLARLHESNLLSIIAHGQHDGHVYEISPYLSAGTLEQKTLDEDVVLHTVVPQLVNALSILHQNNILHNDVKPSNLYWVKAGQEIALGDYDCITAVNGSKQESNGGTPEFMAPETISIGQRSPASDICSAGLTLLALVTGASPLEGKTAVQMRRAWTRGLEINVSSPILRILISKMLDSDPGRRINLDGIKRWLQTSNIHFEESSEKKVRPTPVNSQSTYHLWYKNRPIQRIDELVDCAGEDWEWGLHMLKQRQFGPFLRQFGLEQYELCISCESLFEKDAALFMLLHSLTRTEDFFWYGVHYANLLDFVNSAVDSNDEVLISRSAHFLRTGMLTRYFINVHASPDKIARAEELAKTAHSKPALALSELLLSMNSSPEMKWKNQVFRSLNDVAFWIASCTEELDIAVKELYGSQRFEAWLKYIGEANFLSEVKVMAEG